MGIENEAKCFVEKMEDLYFVKRDAEALLQQMYQDTSWIGTGAEEISKNLVDARKALQKEFEEYGGSFQILEQELFTTKLSDTVCVVYGWIHALPEQDEIEEQNLHLTAICIQTAEGMKLAHCNVSRPDDVQEMDKCYVAPSVRVDNQTLRGSLQHTKKQLQNLMHHIPGGVHQCQNNPNLTLLQISDGFLDLFGYTREEIASHFDNQFMNMVYPEDRADMLRTMHKQLEKGDSVELEYRVFSKEKGAIWILDKGRRLIEEEGETFYCILVEITERKKAQEQLRLSLEKHQIIIDQAVDIIFEWDIQEDTLEFSKNWRRKFGYDPISHHISKNIPLSSNIHPSDMPVFIKIMRDTAMGVPYSEAEFRICDITGSYYWNRIRATAQFDESGRAIKAVGIITDITAQKEEKMALMEQAQKDALTGLYNKAATKLLIEQQIARSDEEEKQALLIIDVDNFKQVNDTYGHLCGDTILSDIAAVLKMHFRSSDLIGRIGGDEFLIYLPKIMNETVVKEKTKSVLTALSKIKPAPEAAPMTCSIGAVVFPGKETDYLGLYQCADRALYQQKNNGRNGITFYGPDTQDTFLGAGLVHSAVSESIDSERIGTVDEKLVQYTFQMLYQSIDVETAVNRLLEIVGRSYGVSRVYIFESSEDGLACNNTFEWCASGVTPEMEHLQGIRYKEDLGDYLQNFDEEGIFYCHDITTLNESLYSVLAPQGIRSLLQCAILDKGEFKGYVGFDECKENCLWNKEQIHSLTLIANVLSIFLIKMRLEEELKNR